MNRLQRLLLAVVSAIAGATLCLTNARALTLQPIARLGFGDVYSVAYSAHGDLLAVGSSAGVQLLDGATGSPVGVLLGHSDDVPSVAFSPDGSTLASSSSDRTIKLWDVAARLPEGSLIRDSRSGQLRTRAVRERDGIPIADDVWQSVSEVAETSATTDADNGGPAHPA